MIPCPGAQLTVRVSIPRESGDDPQVREFIGETLEYSPRERG